MSKLSNFIFAAALVTAFAIPTASAQEDGCTQQNPCPILATVDVDGFSGDSEWNATVGDWFVLEVFNQDSEDHDVRCESLGIAFEILPFEDDQSNPFQMPEGDHVCIDEPSGGEAYIHGFSYDVVAGEEVVDDPVASESTPGDDGGVVPQPSQEPSKKSPGPAAGLVVLAVAALALRRK